jgi:hypothetical protein
VSLDSDGNAAYETIGLDQQDDGEYGNAFYEYTTAVRSISYSMWITDVGGGAPVHGYASVGIGDVTLSAIPEPGTGLLASLGLIGLTLLSRRLRSRRTRG